MKTDSMYKLAVVVAILCALTDQSSGSEGVFLDGVRKSDAFVNLDFWLFTQIVDRDVDTNLKLISKYTKTTTPDLRTLPTIKLAKLITELTSHRSVVDFCTPENLATLGRIADMSIDDKMRGFKAKKDFGQNLSRILGNYIESRQCTDRLQARWDELRAEPDLTKKYEKSLRRLDKFNAHFAQYDFPYRPDEVRIFYGALILNRLVSDGHVKNMIFWNAKNNRKTFTFYVYMKLLSKACARLREEQVSKEVLRPLVNYAAIEITSTWFSMLKWAARLATCETMRIVSKKYLRRIRVNSRPSS